MDAAIQSSVKDDQGDRDPLMPPALVAETTIPVATIRIVFDNASSDKDNDTPVRPAQVGAACHGVDEAVKSSVKEDHGDNNALLPPSQTSALKDGMEGNENNASSADRGHTALVARAYDEMESAIKQHIQDAAGSGINPPVPPALVARAYGKMGHPYGQPPQKLLLSEYQELDRIKNISIHQISKQV